MGIDVKLAEILLSKRNNINFRRCITLGRQNLFIGNSELRSLLKKYNLNPSNYPKLFTGHYTRFRYSEAFWEVLGTEKLDMLDMSDYEGANIIHDLNKPIPENLKERFDVVCDFGTLEHVFNAPVALQNCLEMLALNGNFIVQTPANNYFGHGFYQFSPEFFFRTLVEDNGFKIEDVLLVEYGIRKRWYRVKDPALIKARVSLINSYPIMLFIFAKRISIKPIFKSTPYQSDCDAQWKKEFSAKQNGEIDRLATSRLSFAKVALLEYFPTIARSLESLRFSRFNPDWNLNNKQSFDRLKDYD